MISVEEALDRILSNISILEKEERPIIDCLGQVLSEDIHSEINVPPWNNSAFDGYAVRSIDIAGASTKAPKQLRIIETVSAGAMPKRTIEPGTAIRIMTGAPVPQGADCVVKFEDTDENERPSTMEIGIKHEEKSGANIRLAGESIIRGSLVLAKGTLIRPQEIGVIASIGISKAVVIRRPVVAILATGDELVDPGQPISEGKIYNSNGYSVAAQVRRYGGIPKLLGIAQDNENSVAMKIQQGMDADMLITIGGVSMGDYDVVKDFLSRQGEIVFWKVRTKPGKPLAFGTIKGFGNNKIRNLPHLGLAGNSVSCMINFELFARPAILKMMGRRNLIKPTIEAILEDSIINKDGRRVFDRVKVERRNDQYYAHLTGPQGSGILTSMTAANGLAIVPEDKTKVERGEKVKVMMLDWSEEC